MIILDTNVLSVLMQPPADRQIIHWLDAQLPESLWTTSVSLFEIQYGLETLPAGRRKNSLRDAFECMLYEDFNGRVLNLDPTTSLEAGIIAARQKTKGRPIEFRDAMIAGITAAQQGTLATRNIKHFADTGIPLINPWEHELG